MNITGGTNINKNLSLLLLSLCIILFSSTEINAASRYNENQDPAQFVIFEHFVLREVRADRSMRSNAFDSEKEDHWKIWFHFSVAVTNVELKWHAVDGTNDMDTRDYTDTWDSLQAGEVKDKSHDNFPTYVDDMEMQVTYTTSGTEYTVSFSIFTIGEEDQGSSPLNVLDETPEDEKDTDSGGSFGSDTGLADPVGKAVDAVYEKLKSIIKPLEDIVDGIKTLVTAPYNFLMWMVQGETIGGTVFSLTIIFISFFVMMRVPLAYAIALLVPFLLGISMLVGVILDGIGVWNPT